LFKLYRTILKWVRKDLLELWVSWTLHITHQGTCFINIYDRSYNISRVSVKIDICRKDELILKKWRFSLCIGSSQFAGWCDVWWILWYHFICFMSKFHWKHMKWWKTVSAQSFRDWNVKHDRAILSTLEKPAYVYHSSYRDRISERHVFRASLGGWAFHFSRYTTSRLRFRSCFIKCS
jgi:hypothetical protein